MHSSDAENAPGLAAQRARLKALEAAVGAIYFNDRSDYGSALWAVVRNLCPVTAQDLERDPAKAYQAVLAAAADDGSGVAGRLALEAPVGTEARVCEDIAARQRLGIKKYGTTVEGSPIPLREWLVHAYQEALDMSVYLRRSIEELDKAEAPQRAPGNSA